MSALDRSLGIPYRQARSPPASARSATAPIALCAAGRASCAIAAAVRDAFSRAGRACFNWANRNSPETATEESPMDLGMTPKVKPLVEKVRAMVREEIMPLEEEYEAEIGKGGNRWTYTKRQEEIREGLKAKARERGLWNFWLTTSKEGYGLTTVEYAYLAEEMGWSRLAPETFNCSAPDTGNMEVLERYGSPEHKEKWLKPLLEGKIRSAYVMTEPGVASSDATNLAMRRQARRQRVGAQRREVVRLRRRRSALQDLHRHGLHRPHGGEAQAPLADPGSGRHQGRRDPARHEGVRRRRCPARPHAHPLHGRARAQGEPDPRASAAASRYRRAGSGRAASTTACAPSASRSGRWRRCAGARCRARRSASRWPSSAPTTTSSPRAA